MNFYVLTLFPEMIEQGMSHSVMGRAVKEGIIRISAVNIRDFTRDRLNHVDDYPYGGGSGMVMQAEPVYEAYKSLSAKTAPGTRVVYMTPQGKPFTQEKAAELSREEDLILLCGHYEGIDERVVEEIVTDEISMGDFILSGGEIPAMAVMDAVARLIPGVLGNGDSSLEESFSGGLLEYPQYTRPPEFLGRKAPEVLLSGHHANVEKWRREQAILRTAKKRPELLKKADLSREERKLLETGEEDA